MMKANTLKGAQTPTPTPDFGAICIDTIKVFDWIRVVNTIENKVNIPDTCLPVPQGTTATCRIIDHRCFEAPTSTRAPVTVNGITLNRVTITVTGTVEVTLTRPDGTTCTFTFDFTRNEDFALCAPQGTVINCSIVASQCRTTEILGQLLEVRLDLCKDIQVEAQVKLMVDAEECFPRENIPIPEPPPFACPPVVPLPQCPEVFPG
ncbi:MAG TPA: hypothetical protein VIK75_09370 [Calditerricola sp.]